MTTVNVGTQTYPVGITNRDFALPAVSISSFSISADFSAWVLPATLRFALSFSFDGGVTYSVVQAFTQKSPPPWPTKFGGTSSTMVQSTQYPNAIVQPTNARITIETTGNPITIGPSSITVN